MSPLIFVAAALSISALAVTVYALFSAPEGYQDARGFHEVEDERLSEPMSDSTEGQTGAGGARPYVTAP